MLRTKNFGKLDLIGQVNVRKLGGYSGLERMLENNNINYKTDTISSKSPLFSGGDIYLSDNGNIVISSYSRLVHPRFIGLKKLFVYELYIIKKDDFDQMKSKLPIKQYRD